MARWRKIVSVLASIIAPSPSPSANNKTPPTGAVVVLSNPRLNGNNLAYDARTLKGDLPATGIEGTLFIDGSGGYCEPGYDMAYPTYPCWAY